VSLSIEVEFLRGIYESGSAERREESEWPPAPARLFCALVAAASGEEADDALRWLEEQPPPSIWMSGPADRTASLSRESYVPLNEIEKKPAAYGRFPSRKAGALQQWRHVSPRRPEVKYVWPTSAPEAVHVALDNLASAIPYLGRSTCPVEVRLMNASEQLIGDPGDGVVEFVPGGVGSSTIVDVPRPGYLAALRDAFDDDIRSHEVPRRRLSYGLDVQLGAAVSSPYDSNLIVLPFLDGRKIGGAHVMAASRSLLKALESRLDGGPLVLRGARPGEDRPEFQVLLLGLPDVLHGHATGFIAGMAVALPRNIEPTDRRAIINAILEVEAAGVAAGALGMLEFAQTPSTLSALNASRWTRPSTCWVTATPMSANRFVDLRKSAQAIDEVIRCCRHAGMPDPVDVEVSLAPLCEGAVAVRPNLRQRRAGDVPLPSFHVRLRFGTPIEGPVALGNLRRYGLGLFIPEDDQ
jgi:CRISPR-associated protein Csb2